MKSFILLMGTILLSTICFADTLTTTKTASALANAWKTTTTAQSRADSKRTNDITMGYAGADLSKSTPTLKSQLSA